MFKTAEVHLLAGDGSRSSECDNTLTRALPATQYFYPQISQITQIEILGFSDLTTEAKNTEKVLKNSVDSVVKNVQTVNPVFNRILPIQ